jgi:hypothetical protein
MSTTTENMEEALKKYIRRTGYNPSLQYYTTGEFIFVEINAGMLGENPRVRICIAGLNPLHPRVKTPYLSCSINGGVVDNFNYDQTEPLDDFITRTMDFILLPPKRPGRNPAQRIEALENAQKRILALTDQLQRFISELDSKVKALEDYTYG